MLPDIPPPPRRWAALLCLTLWACGLPRDADGTSDRVGGGVMRVGVIENPPWATRDGGGIEGALARELARSTGARPLWIAGPEASLLEALHARELDLVIGGLTADSPWAAKVALTRSYYTDTIAVAPSTDAPHALRGARIAIAPGDPIAADLREQDATPVFANDLARVAEPVAAPTWRLAALGRAPVGRTLREARHVLAVAPGENRWLVTVERLLRAREEQVPAALRGAR